MSAYKLITPDLYLNAKLLQDGLALKTGLHENPLKENLLNCAQNMAKSAKLNFWGLGEKRRVTPSRFRHEQKKTSAKKRIRKIFGI